MAKRRPVYVMTSYRIQDRGIMNTFRLGYGFHSALDADDRAALGQIDPRGEVTSTGTLVVFGANRPQPARASKRTATGTKSSYVSDRYLSRAKADGWRIPSTGKGAGPGQARTTLAVYVELADRSKYAWNMNQNRFAIYGPTLGIKAVTMNDKVFFGASYPRPAVFGKELDNRKQISSYADINAIDQLLVNGWRELHAARSPWA